MPLRERSLGHARRFSLGSAHFARRSAMRELGVLSGNLAALDRLALFNVFGHLPE